MKSTFLMFALTVIIFTEFSQQELANVARICKDVSSLRCSGTLIARNLVLTSGYCVYKTPKVRVYVGISDDLCSKKHINDNRIYTVDETNVFIYPAFHKITDNRFYDDIAIIRLPVPVTLTSAVKVATLSTSPVDKLAGKSGFVYGWGMKIKEQSTAVTVHNEETCVNIFGDQFNKSQHGCVKVNDIHKMYLLDPGSPVECNNEVIGYKTNDNIIDTKASFLVVDASYYKSFIDEIKKKFPVNNIALHLQSSLFFFISIQLFFIFVN